MAAGPQTINEEAGLGPNWVPLDGPPIMPGQMAAAPPASDMTPVNPKYLSGTIAPNFQHDTSFTDTATMSTRAPKFDLMPLGPQQNAVSSTQISSTVRTTVESIPSTPAPASSDDDLIKLNLQTGTSYTVQQSDLNKLISISNAAGGTVFLPPISGSSAAAVTNHVDTPFNSGNTTTLMQTATSVFTFSATAPVAVGDFLFLAIRNVSSHLDSATVAMSDNHNGSWSKVSVPIDDPAVGTDTLSLFWIRNTVALAIGGNLTLTFAATFATTVFSPDANEFWTMSGIKSVGTGAQSSSLSSGSTFSSGVGISVTAPTTFISIADSNNGSLSTQTPAASQGKSWTGFTGGSSSAARFNYLIGITSGLVNDVYTPAASGHGVIDILQAFNQATPSDVQELTSDFFCYVENTGAGTFNLVSAAPIDGSAQPLAIGPNQGTLLVWDAATQAWYTERGMSGGGTDTDFYQTVQQAGASKPQESKLNFLAPITAADNAGNSSTDIAVPVFVGSGASHATGLVPDPGSSAGTSHFLREDANFAIPPTMVGDSGSGGTAGYAPAPGAGDNAAGKFLSAGGTYVNPGSNPASFNTGLVYAIAAGYSLG